MRGHGTSVMPVTAGCRKDIERLLKMYKEKETLRYKPFIELFEQTHFATIFMGRISPAELFEFSEKLLQIAISFAMSYHGRKPAGYVDEPSIVTEPVSVSDMRFSNEMTLQPENYVAQVRVTPDQMADLTDFINERLIPERHVDAFTALFKLINGGAFRIIAFEKEYNPQLHRRFDLIELDEGGFEDTKGEEYSFLKALGDDVVLMQADIICKRYLDEKEKAKLPPELNINLVQTTVSEIYGDILKSIEMEKEGSSSPKKVAGQNSGRFRSALKEKAYKSHIVHSRHRRHFIDPSVPSPSTSAESETDALSASQILRTLRCYAAGETDKDRKKNDSEDILASAEVSNEDHSQVSEVEGSKTDGSAGKTVKKGASTRKRRRSKLSISEMSLAELARDLGESVYVLSQEEGDAENFRKERIADRLLEKIQKACERNER